jgi:flagellar assembly factor FliW
MAVCFTKYEGAIEYAEDAVIEFPRGLFAFEEETRFLLIERPSLSPLVYLQSLSTPQLCFLALPVFVVCGDYELALCPGDLTEIGLPGDSAPRIGSDVLCLVLLTIRENRPTTANLMAPVTIGLHNRKGLQAICERRYSHQHVFPELHEEAACS